MYRWCVLMASAMLVGGAGETVAQSTSPDPWSRVPAAATSFYSDDDFISKVETEYAAINANIDKQAAINAAIKKSFDEMDMAQKMQRIQAYMAKNPQEAMKVMQAMQASANTTTEGVNSTSTNSIKLEQELAGHKTNFSAALDKTLKPLQARQDELIKTRTKAVSEGEMGFKTAADAAQYAALVQQENAEYEKICGSFFGPKGEFTTWLASYKENIAKNMIPAGEANDRAIVTQLSIMDTPTGGYRSTAGLEGVRDYLGKLRELYGLRRHKKVLQLT